MRTWIGLFIVLLCAGAVTADTTERIAQAVQEFRGVIDRAELDKYVLSVQFTTLADQSPHHNDIVLSHDETWESWCLDVTVGINLPPNIKAILPATFWEFKVFYNPAGTPPYDPFQSSSSQSESSSSESESSNSDSESSSSEEWPMCSMIALLCADGSVATRTRDCLQVCGGAPHGGLSYDQVTVVKDQFEAAYGRVTYVSIDTLYGKKVRLSSTEKMSDYCLDVGLTSSDSSVHYPAVYNGVRVFYYTQPNCSPQLCPDGSLVGCNDECPSASASSSSAVFTPVLAVLFLVLLSTCCCYIRRRRCRAAKRAITTTTTTPTHQPSVHHEFAYPSEQYSLLRHQEQQEVDAPQMTSNPMVPVVPVPMMPPQMMNPQMMNPQMMNPQMMAYHHHMQMMMAHQMGMMPHMPPPMMMPNGSYPVMMQGPNGMWFPAPPHPEDA